MLIVSEVSVNVKLLRLLLLPTTESICLSLCEQHNWKRCGLILMKCFGIVSFRTGALKCFDAVGFMTGRRSGL